MPTATINGVRLYYELHGDSGEPLVLVHGFTGDVTDWRHQIPEFSRTHRVLAVDLRGHGRSEATRDRSSYTVEQMADDVEALIDHAGLERYHLLGHSMGGAVVQEIALHSPQRLLSLTLEDTSYRFPMTSDPAVEEWWRTRMALAEAGKMAELADLPPPVPPPPHMPAERLEETSVRLSRMSPDAFVGAFAGWWAGRGRRTAPPPSRRRPSSSTATWTPPRSSTARRDWRSSSPTPASRSYRRRPTRRSGSGRSSSTAPSAITWRRTRRARRGDVREPPLLALMICTTMSRWRGRMSKST